MFADPQTYTLEQVLDLAAKKNEQPQIAQKKLEQLEQKKDQSVAAVLPEVALLGSYQRQDDKLETPTGDKQDPDQTTVRLNVLQPLFRGMRDQAVISSMRAQIRAQEATIDQTLRALRIQVSDAFFKVLAAEADTTDLQSLVDISTRRTQELQQRARIGRTRASDLLSARAQLASAQAQLESARATVRTQRNQFSNVSGIAADVDLKHDANLPASLEPLSAFTGEIDQQPDLKALNEQISAARSEIGAARGQHYPSLDLTGNYYLKREGTLEDVKWDASLQLTIPLYSGGMISAQVHEAALKASELEIQLQQTRRLAETEYAESYELAAGAMAQLKLLQNALELSEKSYQQISEDYRLGLATNLEVLQALNAVVDSRRTLHRTRWQGAAAFAALQLLAGRTL